MVEIRRIAFQRRRIIPDWIMCSMSESDDVGNKAEEGAWERTVQGREFQATNGRPFILLLFTNRPGMGNPGPSFVKCRCKTGRRGKHHLKAVRKSLKIISACLTEMFEIAADSTVAETFEVLHREPDRDFSFNIQLQRRKL